MTSDTPLTDQAMDSIHYGRESDGKYGIFVGGGQIGSVRQSPDGFWNARLHYHGVTSEDRTRERAVMSALLAMYGEKVSLPADPFEGFPSWYGEE